MVGTQEVVISTIGRLEPLIGGGLGSRSVLKESLCLCYMELVLFNEPEALYE